MNSNAACKLVPTNSKLYSDNMQSIFPIHSIENVQLHGIWEYRIILGGTNFGILLKLLLSN